MLILNQTVYYQASELSAAEYPAELRLLSNLVYNVRSRVHTRVTPNYTRVPLTAPQASLILISHGGRGWLCVQRRLLSLAVGQSPPLARIKAPDLLRYATAHTAIEYIRHAAGPSCLSHTPTRRSDVVLPELPELRASGWCAS